MNLDAMVMKFEGDPPPVDAFLKYESAVSIGSVAATKMAISKVLPGVDWPTPNRGVFDAAATGNRFEFNLGDDDPVENMTISVRGAKAAITQLLAIAKFNGWTLVDMSTGAYVSRSTRASSRISALMSNEELPHEVLVASISGELEACIAPIESELLAVIDHFRQLTHDAGTPSESRHGNSLREHIEAIRVLLPQFPPAKASKWGKLLQEVKKFLILFEPYVLALPASKSLHTPMDFEVEDHCTGMKIKAVLPPMAPVLFATEMEELLPKISKARVALVGRRSRAEPI